MGDESHTIAGKFFPQMAQALTDNAMHKRFIVIDGVQGMIFPIGEGKCMVCLEHDISQTAGGKKFVPSVIEEA